MKKMMMVLFSLSLVLTACGGNNNPGSNASPENTANPHPEPESNNAKIQNVDPKSTQHGKMKIESIGFLEPIDANKAVNEVKQVGKLLSNIAFFSYQVKADGSLTPINDDAAIAEAKKAGATPMMVLTNFTEGNFSPDIAHTIFTDKKANNALIQNVLNTMKKKGYEALNVDFEHIREQDRKLYNGFLDTLLPKAKAQGYTTSTALAPKTSDEEAGPWHGAHDYKRHGEIADYVILMTYEWGWSGGPPMAVSPIPQVRQVLDYALSKIPREKIVMGAPLYGYDWTLPYEKGGEFAKRLSPKEAADLAIKENVEVQFDNKAQAPHFKYKDDQGKEHEVWFENEQSMQAKFNLVKEYKLRGIAYWVLGEEFPENWTMLEDQFTIKK